MLPWEIPRYVAALYVDPRGCYVGVRGVDPWDESRDARLYAGPYPVVAHPPCQRWCQMAHANQARYGHRVGDDNGCFAAALAAVRTWGGVLEHPACSHAWAAHGLARPPRTGGWVQADEYGGWTCHVEQCQYGHRARKATWLYAVGCELPDLRWGAGEYTHQIGARDQRGKARNLPTLSGRAAIATPLPFRDVLLAIARSAVG